VVLTQPPAPVTEAVEIGKKPQNSETSFRQDLQDYSDKTGLRP
jgi:hypothetical protein